MEASLSHLHLFRVLLPAVLLSSAALISSLTLAHDMHQSSQALSASGDERAFLRENEAAMAKMMKDMVVKPAGDVDRDFVAMMVPHHQGAIDMAVVELRYGKNEQLRRMAQEIIVDQTQEIAAMKMAIGDPNVAPSAVPTQQEPGIQGKQSK
jgi:uncharacterized protein (DUF305 family)